MLEVAADCRHVPSLLVAAALLCAAPAAAHVGTAEPETKDVAAAAQQAATLPPAGATGRDAGPPAGTGGSGGPAAGTGGSGGSPAGTGGSGGPSAGTGGSAGPLASAGTGSDATAPAPAGSGGDASAPAPTDGDAGAVPASRGAGAAPPSAEEHPAVRAAQAAERAAKAAQHSAQTIERLVGSGQIQGDDTPSAPTASPWTFSLSLNAMAVSGNATARSGKLTAGVDGRWRDWTTELRLSGSYGETYPKGQAPDLTALNAAMQLRGERLYTPALGTYLLGGINTDHVASINYQLYGEGGVSLVWWEQTRADFLRSRLRTSVGFRVTRESRYQFVPVRQAVPNPLRTLLSPTLTGNFRFGFSRTAYFTEDLELQQDINVPHDLRLRSATGLTAQIMQGVALSLTYTVRRLGSPAPGKEPLDTELATGIAWSF